MQRVISSKALKLVIVLLWGFILAGIIWLTMRGELMLPKEVWITDSASLKLYSLIIILAVAVGAAVFEYFRRAEESLKDIDIWEGLVYVIAPGVIGSRIYHVLTDHYYYIDNPGEIIAIWNGGVGVIGAILGGAVGIWFFARKYKIDLEKLVGTAILAVPTAQAIGRLGNLVNRELYGLPTDLPWGMYIPFEDRFFGLEIFAYYHPLFLYEMIGSLTLFLLLYAFYLRGRRGWWLVVVYILGYSAIRFMLDFLRLDGISGVLGLSFAQWLAIIAYIVILVGFIWPQVRAKVSRKKLV